ncbi:MAG: aminotransferase class V-fold PLP-dependent enzyme, partial [Luteimonas sp.]|nr:aminotransferase class V-fold PLP-dependent enzyme [Luteimonas sp.]
MASRSFPDAFAAWRATPGHSFSASAGPLPDCVAHEVSEACRPGPGSILSLPFTSAAYRSLQAETEACLRRLLAIPDDFAVLFMGGGASAQFALLPMNLFGGADCGGGHGQSAVSGGALPAPPRRRALYVDSGHWSRRAIAEARRYGEVLVLALGGRPAAKPDAASGGDVAWAQRQASRGEGGPGVAMDDDGTPHVAPGSTSLAIDAPTGGFAYAHFTTNETADGLQFPALPEVDVPLAADMTSDLLTRPLDWCRLGVAYAGAQKTTGTPGLTFVVVRRTLLGPALAGTPRVMSYAEQAAADSRLCTPPVLPVFVAHRMLHWIEGEGGVPAMAARLDRRHAVLQSAIAEANARFGPAYRQTVAPAWRSRVNPCFQLPDAAACDAFLAAAEAVGLRDLRGHPAVGGVRVSLYHGVADAAVEALAEFLVAFARRRAADRRPAAAIRPGADTCPQGEAEVHAGAACRPDAGGAVVPTVGPTALPPGRWGRA